MLPHQRLEELREVRRPQLDRLREELPQEPPELVLQRVHLLEVPEVVQEQVQLESKPGQVPLDHRGVDLRRSVLERRSVPSARHREHEVLPLRRQEVEQPARPHLLVQVVREPLEPLEEVLKEREEVEPLGRLLLRRQQVRRRVRLVRRARLEHQQLECVTREPEHEHRHVLLPHRRQERQFQVVLRVEHLRRVPELVPVVEQEHVQRALERVLLERRCDAHAREGRPATRRHERDGQENVVRHRAREVVAVVTTEQPARAVREPVEPPPGPPAQ